MITIERYERALQNFSSMDLSASWVTFSQKELIVGGTHHRVIVPQIEQKTYRIIRVVQRIFYYFFGEFLSLKAARLNTARNFDRLISEAINLFPREEDLFDQLGVDVKNGITRVAFQILQKIKRACNNAEDVHQIERYHGAIRHKFCQFRRRILLARRDELVRFRDAQEEVGLIRAELTRVNTQLNSARNEILDLVSANHELCFENLRLRDNGATRDEVG
ncbi:MAG: hypothetical protein PVI40_07925 [Chlamydiota bacterium]|jgi:hypothetical protein